MRTMYFDTKGVTSTSATTIANYAVEKKNVATSFLDNLSFYSEFRDIVGTDSTEKQVSQGYTSQHLNKVLLTAKLIVEYDKLNAWLREAVKAKEQLLADVTNTSFEDYLQSHNISLVSPELPTIETYSKAHDIKLLDTPILKTVTEADIIAEMSIKEYNEYISSNSAAAVYGKLTNPSGSFNTARTAFLRIISAPYEVSETLIKHYSATVDPQEVENVFTELKSIYRTYEGEHNAFLKKIKDEVLARNTTNKLQYLREFEQYYKQREEIRGMMDLEYNRTLEEYQYNRNTALADYKEWQQTELKRISNLKIVIPEALNSIYTELDSQFKRGK